MTSLEIAELVESRHDSVKRTIERIASVGSIELPPMVEVKNHLGQKISVEATISAQAPKVEAFSRIAESDGLHNLTSTAKQMNIRPSTLTNYLSTNQWIYKRAGSKHWVAYQAKIEQGLLRHKTFSYGDSTGETWTREQVMVTPKGLTHLAEIFADKPQQHVTGFRGKNVSPSHINRGRPCLTR
jgi:phage antirepressor YoqD-like protein